MAARPLPLCRLRSCVLLPRADLEIATRGLRPGPGAVAALEAAGDDGTVVVAFEGADDRSGDVHGIGVLARCRLLDRRVGADPRIGKWLLRGIHRVDLDPKSIVETDGVPMAPAERMADRPEDAALPPKEYVDKLAELAESWEAGEQWQHAFQLMARSPLAQWGTSLYALLPVEQSERLELLDRPERLAPLVLEHLERLLAMHSRRRVREAVVKQASGRDPGRLVDNLVSVPTTSSAWVMFHPDDLGHRARDDERWWSGAAVASELKAGTLIGVRTGSERFTFAVRVTSGGLNSRERTLLASHADFRLRSRHGRLFVAEPRHLPSVKSELFSEVLGESSRWIDVPKGFYRVRVNSIAWREEPGAMRPDGTTGDTALAAYVVQFMPVDSLADVEPPAELPLLRAAR